MISFLTLFLGGGGDAVDGEGEVEVEAEGEVDAEVDGEDIGANDKVRE
jgi:hypothetical protein